MQKLRLFITVFILGALSLYSCNNDDEYALPSGKGRINILLTDSPFPVEMVNSAVIYIDKVEIRHKLDGQMEGDTDSFIVVAENQMEINLLDLTNGITEQIATADLEAGTYDMIRLHVTDAAIILNDGTQHDLKIPSGSSSGLKIKIDPAIYLEEGQTSDVLLDFDVSRSFVLKGNMNNIVGFNFKPVVRCVYMGAAGRVEGTVTDTLSNPLENAMVKILLPMNEKSLPDEDSVLTSSFTDADGNYKLIGIPGGIYSVICEMDGFESDTVKDVTVTEGNSTNVDFQLE